MMCWGCLNYFKLLMRVPYTLMANCAAQRVAPAEGFGPMPRIFLLFCPPKRIFMLFLAIFCYFVVLCKVEVSIEEKNILKKFTAAHFTTPPLF